MSAAKARYVKVFLSSTAQDLVEYRRVADDTLLRLSHQVVAMERFGPLPGQPASECERLARHSDLLICLVAYRYGFVPPDGRGSISRREVEAAHGAGKKVLVWMVADDFAWPLPREQDASNVRELREFKAWLRASFVCDEFTTPDDLGRKIAIAIAREAGDIANAASTQRRGEIRIVHALQPAPHFQGREELTLELNAWVADLASPVRVWALVAAGGTGKTAVVERVVRAFVPSEANVLVWSFYEQPDADEFLRASSQLFVGEVDGSADGRRARLERSLRDGRPHLIVLDGLERVQQESGDGRVRGELLDQALKLLLRAIAAGLGRVRALVTSRFPLADLRDWSGRGYRETTLDDLTADAALAVLRSWHVTGEDHELRAAAQRFGNHALSVAVVGSYLQSFAQGRIEALEGFELDNMTGEDVKAAKLARVLGYYAEHLPAPERDLLVRLAVFPRGVTLTLLETLIDAGPEVAGLLVKVRARLPHLLGSLKRRGLVFEYEAEDGLAWTAHPFLRDRFRELLGYPRGKVFEVVARQLRAGLQKRPSVKPSGRDALDRYERLIEATRLAGREREAFELYYESMGGYKHLCGALGEFQRSHRILAGFTASGRAEDLAPTLKLRDRSRMAGDLSICAEELGKLAEAWEIRQIDDAWRHSLRDPERLLKGLSNSCDVALALGLLPKARALAEAATIAASGFDWLRAECLAYRSFAAHRLGEVVPARLGFMAATHLERADLISLRGAQYARYHIDRGELEAAAALCEGGLTYTVLNHWNQDRVRFHALLGRIALARGENPERHLIEMRAWTSRTGAMEWIIEAHLIAATHLHAIGDSQAALGEVETGLSHAQACGYGTMHIEGMVSLARVLLDWPDRPRAIEAAREALREATHVDCSYAWGEADAAQVLGEAYCAIHERESARAAFEQALAVRRRIEHPGVRETEQWLNRSSLT